MEAYKIGFTSVNVKSAREIIQELVDRGEQNIVLMRGAYDIAMEGSIDIKDALSVDLNEPVGLIISVNGKHFWGSAFSKAYIHDNPEEFEHLAKDYLAAAMNGSIETVKNKPLSLPKEDL
jgi:hypothetical protein